MCKYLKILTEKTPVPDKNGGIYFEDIPYADECIKDPTNPILCPNCVECQVTKEGYNKFINSIVTTDR